MPDLPITMQVLLSSLASDQGRRRAETLMQVVAMGPDILGSHAPAVHEALGSTSPGLDALIAIANEAANAVTPTQPTVERQHIISQVVIRRFSHRLPGEGRRVAQLKLANGTVDHPKVQDVGFVANFIQVDSERTERMWGEVENGMRQATDAARNGKVFTSPNHLSTLRRAVALHFARNPQTELSHHASFEASMAESRERFLRSGIAAAGFRVHHGLHAAGPEALEMAIEELQRPMRDLYERGGLYRLSVQRLYEQVCDRFDLRGFELLTPANPRRRFVLGDCPALTVDHTAGAVGIAGGVTIDEADEIVMPLDPRLLLSVQGPTGFRTLDDSEVDRYNAMQIAGAREYVISDPSDDIVAYVEAIHPLVAASG